MKNIIYKPNKNNSNTILMSNLKKNTLFSLSNQVLTAFLFLISAVVLSSCTNSTVLEVSSDSPLNDGDNTITSSETAETYETVYPANNQKGIDPRTIRFSWKKIDFGDNIYAVDNMIHIKSLDKNEHVRVGKSPKNYFIFGVSANLLKLKNASDYDSPLVTKGCPCEDGSSLSYAKNYHWYVTGTDKYGRTKSTPYRYFRTKHPFSEGNLPINFFDSSFNGQYRSTIMNMSGLLPSSKYKVTKATITSDSRYVREVHQIMTDSYGILSHRFERPFKIFDYFIVSYEFKNQYFEYLVDPK